MVCPAGERIAFLTLLGSACSAGFGFVHPQHEWALRWYSAQAQQQQQQLGTQQQQQLGTQQQQQLGTQQQQQQVRTPVWSFQWPSAHSSSHCCDLLVGGKVTNSTVGVGMQCNCGGLCNVGLLTMTFQLPLFVPQMTDGATGARVQLLREWREGSDAIEAERVRMLGECADGGTGVVRELITRHCEEKRTALTTRVRSYVCVCLSVCLSVLEKQRSQPFDGGQVSLLYFQMCLGGGIKPNQF